MKKKDRYPLDLRSQTQPLQKYLESLGSIPDEVADTVRAVEIKGRPQYCNFCPVAELVKRRFRLKAWQVEIDVRKPSDGVTAAGFITILVDADTETGLDTVEVELPTPVASFAYLFDEGEYPDLNVEQGYMATEYKGDIASV